MYLDKSEAQSKDIKDGVKKLNVSYDQVRLAAEKFAATEELKGRAYESGKQFFTTVIQQLLVASQTLADLTEESCSKFVEQYKSDVDNVSLKESELEEDIRRCEQRIMRLENMNASMAKHPSKNRAEISENNSVIASITSQKQELEKKLRDLRSFDAESPSIFKEVEAFQSIVQQAISASKITWNPGTKQFDIPSENDMEWAQISYEKYLDVRMRKIAQKAKNGKLTKEETQFLIEYSTQRRNQVIPESVVKYIRENSGDFIKDLGVESSEHLITLLGKKSQTFGAFLNTRGGVKGPAGSNQFVEVTSQNGTKFIKYGSQMIKMAGPVSTVISFADTAVEDLREGKSVGSAVTHAGFVTTASALGMAMGVMAATVLLTNPAGWAVLAGIGASIIVGLGANLVYEQVVSDKVERAIEYSGEQISKAVDEGKKVVNNSKEWLGDKYNEIGEGVAKNIKEVGKSLNPMKWSF